MSPAILECSTFLSHSEVSIAEFIKSSNPFSTVFIELSCEILLVSVMCSSFLCLNSFAQSVVHSNKVVVCEPETVIVSNMKNTNCFFISMNMSSIPGETHSNSMFGSSKCTSPAISGAAA